MFCDGGINETGTYMLTRKDLAWALPAFVKKTYIS